MASTKRKTKTGLVVSDKMDKTVTVVVAWKRPHRIYRKPVRRMSKFKAHDEENQSKVGDLVRLEETRPISKTKRWTLKEIISRPETFEVESVEVIPEILTNEQQGESAVLSSKLSIAVTAEAGSEEVGDVEVSTAEVGSEEDKKERAGE